jgi:hypothetical protein
MDVDIEDEVEVTQFVTEMEEQNIGRLDID